jgi:hypothetical protein
MYCMILGYSYTYIISTIFYSYILCNIIITNPCPGELWTSINYGESFIRGALYSGYGQNFNLGGLAMSSNGTKVIAALYKLGNLCVIASYFWLGLGFGSGLLAY